MPNFYKFFMEIVNKNDHQIRETIWEIRDYLNYGFALERRMEYLPPIGNYIVLSNPVCLHVQIHDMMDAKFCAITLEQIEGIPLTQKQQERFEKWYKERGQNKFIENLKMSLTD